MPQEIWKFRLGGLPLSPGYRRDVEMPSVNKVLSVQKQADDIFFWAQIDPDSPKVKVPFYMFGTGWQLPKNIDELQYVATVQHGIYVWHFYKESSP